MTAVNHSSPRERVVVIGAGWYFSPESVTIRTGFPRHLQKATQLAPY